MTSDTDLYFAEDEPQEWQSFSDWKREFYQSPEWRDLRYAVLSRAEFICEACGHSPREHGVVMHGDHIVPLSVDPSLALVESNIQALCEVCNMGKKNQDAIDWATGEDRLRTPEPWTPSPETMAKVAADWWIKVEGDRRWPKRQHQGERR